jgi:ADP-ribose pyrophosphatase YjhB (NUDIX family)
MNKKPFSEKEFKNIFSRVSRVTTSLIVKSEDGIVLTLRTLPSWNNQWHLPGSTILYKETVMKAVHRVAKQELGIEIKSPKLLGWIEYPSAEKERGFGWDIDLVFLCNTTSKKFKVDEDASEVKAFKKLPKNIIKEQGKFLKKNWGTIFS